MTKIFKLEIMKLKGLSLMWIVTIAPMFYELLKFLMINKGKVVTKNQIYRNVWQNEFVEDDNTVMVHISKLREKIEEDPKAPRRLKTIRGIGYRFEGE